MEWERVLTIQRNQCCHFNWLDFPLYNLSLLTRRKHSKSALGPKYLWIQRRPSNFLWQQNPCNVFILANHTSHNGISCCTWYMTYIQRDTFIFNNYLASINSDDMRRKIGTNRACNPFTYRRFLEYQSVNTIRSLPLFSKL